MVNGMKPRRVFPAPRLCLLAGFLLLALPSQAFCPTGVMRQFSARPACSGCPQLGVCSEARAPGARRSVLALSMQETSPDDVTSELGASMPSQSMPLQQQVGNSSGEHMNLQKAKFGLLAAVAGLDRGAAAGSLQRKAVLTAAEALEKESNLEPFPAGLSKIDGLWRLVYSSALSAGSGSGGGASSQSLPVFQTPDTGSFNSFGPGSQVGQVYARISSRKQKLENIVEVFLRSPLPFLPQLGKVTLNLEHKLEVEDGDARRVKITLEQVTARNQGGPARQLRLPPLKIPVLDVLSSQGAGIFDTTYCDDELRITRGDRGEIRVFVKA